MEANLKKFVCKYCNKKFQCGKSLGGHIRIHFQGSSTTSRTDFDDDDGSNGSKFNYGLREKPKKSSRFVLNNSDFARVCRECGKGFQSLKALCGHMACHSKNSSSCFDDDDGDLELDSESDTESYKKRRSKRIRFKKIGTQSESFSVGYDSSCFASDIEQEQEEVAMSLMMLSRDSGFKGWFSSVSSDNNSVVLEDSRKIRSVNFVDNGDQREVAVSAEKERSANSDSGYFNGESEQVDYESTYHGFIADSGFKKRKLEMDSDDDEEFDAELGKRLSRFRQVKSNRGKDVADDYGSDRDNIGSLKRSFRKGGKFTDENSIDTGNRKIKQCSKKVEKRVASKKGKLHECPFCSKVFKSGQALGGHKRSHFVGGAGEDRTIVIKEVEQPSLIDLNLPAPAEEDSNWVQSKW